MSGPAFHNVEQGTDEWLALRVGLITASRVSAVLSTGKGRADYMYQLIAERAVGGPTSRYSNAAMQWGIDTEPRARYNYELVYELDVVQVGFVTNHNNPGVGVSPDGLVGSDGLIEIKCPNTETHMAYRYEGRVPPVYRAQIQCQLWITERQWCDFVSFDPRVLDERALFCTRMERDEKYIAEMATAVDAFISEMRVREASTY